MRASKRLVLYTVSVTKYRLDVGRVVPSLLPPLTTDCMTTNIRVRRVNEQLQDRKVPLRL